MAAGALSRCPADIVVAISGVAGPEPDEDGNAVGLVYVAGSASDRPPTVIQCNFAAIGPAFVPLSYRLTTRKIAPPHCTQGTGILTGVLLLLTYPH
jgi:nicotinamide mononucleotide (NMN) deamidase PncC